MKNKQKLTGRAIIFRKTEHINNQKETEKLISEFFSKLLPERGNRLVIFIDELDRIKGMPESEKLLHDFGKPLFEFDNPLVYIGSTTVIESYINAKKIAVDVYSTNAEMYDELKGRFNSEDLIIFRDGKLVNPTDAENFKIKDNETSNTNLHL